MSVTAATAQIHDRGYRRYDGRRLGRAHAIRSLTRHSFQRILGLRRPARYKILPFLCVIIAYLPAAVFVGVIALIPGAGRGGPNDIAPTYSGYYGFITAAITLFVTFVAPESLCPDRHWRTLSLYLASPLDRVTYLLSKAIAVVSALLLVTVGPILLLLIGFVLQNRGPDGPWQVTLTLLRILGAGLMLSLDYAAISMMVSSVTDRRAFAGAGTFLLLAISQALSGFLVFGVSRSRYFLLLSLSRTPLDLIQRFYGDNSFNRGLGFTLSTWSVVLATVGTIVIAFGAVLWRYRSLQVTR